MARVQLQFVLGRSWSSDLIAWLGADPRHGFSHVDLVLPDGNLLGARSDKVGGKPPGVQIRRQGYERWRSRVVFEIVCGDLEASLFYNEAHAQVGKPYDHTAIAAFVANRDWRDTDAWFCSELAMHCLEFAGLCPTLYAPENKIHPTEAAIIVSALGAHTVLEVSYP